MLKCWWSFSYSGRSSPYVEPRCSLPCSQHAAAGPRSGPDESFFTPCHCICLRSCLRSRPKSSFHLRVFEKCVSCRFSSLVSYLQSNSVTIFCVIMNKRVVFSEPIYTNKGIRQGCGLSPALFSIHINKIIHEFKLIIKKGIPLNNRKILNTIPWGL